jgi:cytochrome c oxidase assembly factor CtaG
MSLWVDANGWPVPPAVLLGCLVAEILYFRGWSMIVHGLQLKEAARAAHPSVFTGSISGDTERRRWLWRSAFFLGALLTFLLASCAFVDNLASRLLWVHMIQHLLILVVMAPLLVAGSPALLLWLGLPRQARRLLKRGVHLKVRLALYAFVQWLRRPIIACVLLLAGTWTWHWPPLYDLALRNAAIHDWGEHTTFLLVSLLFWSLVIPSYPALSRLSYGKRIACVGFAIAQNIVLAVLIGFAPTPLYAPYAHLVTGPGALTALQDQQFGAGIMWTFGDLPFGIAFSTLIHRWLTLQLDAGQDEAPAPAPGVQKAGSAL